MASLAFRFDKNLMSAGALPRTPLRELTMLPLHSSLLGRGTGGGYPSQFSTPHDVYSILFSTLKLSVFSTDWHFLDASATYAYYFMKKKS